jgi:hypothetical protein
MSNVEFDDSTNSYKMSNPSSQRSGIAGWLVRQGSATDVADANKKLVVVALICIIAAFLIPYFFGQRVEPANNLPVEEGYMPPQGQ